MRVVNIRKASYTVYIGRAGHGQDGFFGNPIRLNATCPVCERRHETRGSTLGCYEQYLRTKLASSASFARRFASLSDDDVLGCFCKPDACHGDVMVKVWEETQNAT